MEEKQINIKDYLQETWDFVFKNWRVKKYDVIDKMINCKNIVFCMEVTQHKDLEQYRELLNMYEKLCNDYDENIGKYRSGGTGIFVVDWIIERFIKAVIENTNLYKLRKDKDLMRKLEFTEKTIEKLEKRNNLFCYLMQEFIKGDIDTVNFENNFEVFIMDQYKEYRVKNIPLFKDSLKPIKYNGTLYHGTRLDNAKSILMMNKLFSKDIIGTGATSDSFFNVSKIFFTENFDDSIEYAKRWNDEPYYIVFELDLSKYDVYERYHLQSTRGIDKPLYFVEAKEIPVNEVIKKVYLIEGEEIREISIEEVQNIKTEETEELQEAYEKFRKQKIEYKNSLEDYNNKIQEVDQFIKSTMEKENVGYEEAGKLLGLQPDNIEEIQKVLKVKENRNIKFKDLYAHARFLKELDDKYSITFKDDTVYVWHETNKSDQNVLMYPLKIDNYRMFHGTSCDAVVQILKDGQIKGRRVGAETIDYNKVFFTQHLEYSLVYGNVGGIITEYTTKDMYAVLEVDLSNYQVYHFKNNMEYIVWGDVKAEDIINIHYIQDNKIISTLNKETIKDILRIWHKDNLGHRSA